MTRIDLPREKKVAHLTLLRQPRSITGKEFNALTFAERLDMIRSVGGRQKYDLLIEAQDAEQLVQKLPAQEIYLLIKELGLPDVPELLSFADAGQFAAFIDLDCWRGDLLDDQSAMEWFAVLFRSGEEKVLEIARGLDFPQLALVLKKLVTVLRGPEDYLDEDARLEASQRDGGYELAFRDPEAAKVATALFDIINRHEPELFTRLLEALRWEEAAVLEEENYQERNVRLEALGFPDPFEARAIYAWLDPMTFDPADFRRAGTTPQFAGEAPGFVLTAVRPRDLLAEVLAGGIDHESAWELTWLLNKVMTADRLDVGDVPRVREEIGEACRYLNLALEHLCGGDVELAARLFADTYLQALFRLGFSLTLALQRRALNIVKSAINPYLDGPFRALADALTREKPHFFEGIEDSTRAGERPFAALRDLRLAGEWLDRLEVQQRLFTAKLPFTLPAPDALDLAGCFPDRAEDLALSDFLLTALANRLLGREFLPVAVAAAEVAVLQEKVCRSGGVDPGLRQETCSWLDALEPGAGAFGGFCLDIWEEEFCAVAAEDLDPRYLSGMIVRAGK